MKVVQLEPTAGDDTDSYLALVHMISSRMRGLREIRIMRAANAGTTEILRALNGQVYDVEVRTTLTDRQIENLLFDEASRRRRRL